MSLTRKQKHVRWMILCLAGAIEFSTCTKRNYMAIICDKQNHVIGMGYNGVPSRMQHCIDGGCPRAFTDSKPGSTYNNCNSLHAEANALLHSDYTARRDGGTMYVNGTPCWDCTKLIANAGITALVYMRDTEYVNIEQSEQFLADAGIELIVLTEDDLTDF